jgi:CHAD domain-containing protein
MKKKYLKRYLESEWKKANKSLKAFLKKRRPEALHHFRVQVKKLRAFITLAQETNASGKLKKYFKPVDKIFGKAGTIRDAQLQIALGEQQKAGKDFLTNQKKEEQKNIRQFLRHGQRYRKLTAQTRRHIEQHLQSLPGKKIRTYYEDQLQWIAVHLGKDNEMLHACRKQIKTLLYDFKFAHNVLPNPLNRDYLKALEKAIGKWHDNALAAQLFPALQKKEKGLIGRVQLLSKDFHQRAIHAL